MGVGGPWRVSMDCMDELMDKNLPYFVGGNLATLAQVRKAYDNPLTLLHGQQQPTALTFTVFIRRNCRR